MRGTLFWVAAFLLLGCVQSDLPSLEIVSVSPPLSVSVAPSVATVGPQVSTPSPAVELVSPTPSASQAPLASASPTPNAYVDPFSVMKSHDDSVSLEFEQTVPKGKPVLFRVNSPVPVYVHAQQSWTVYKQYGDDSFEEFAKLPVDNYACWPSCSNACGPGACTPVSNACQQAATWVWDQKSFDVGAASCSFGKVSCVNDRVPVEPGLYKIVFIYSLSCPNGTFDSSLDIRTFKQVFQIR
ncbi:hypothetical protein HY572_06215 [Candidatus Micrarchaeota archaeon]|nr:hypothetical protein [Candidatus Micrarchaeota archaeon]